MNNNGWITDRLPTEEDGVNINGWSGQVWAQVNNFIKVVMWEDVKQGTPWQPIHVPELYVEPKRWRVEIATNAPDSYVVSDIRYSHYLPIGCTREAAERICDIYNEVLP